MTSPNRDTITISRNGDQQEFYLNGVRLNHLGEFKLEQCANDMDVTAFGDMRKLYVSGVTTTRAVLEILNPEIKYETAPVKRIVGPEVSPLQGALDQALREAYDIEIDRRILHGITADETVEDSPLDPLEPEDVTDIDALPSLSDFSGWATSSR